MHAKIGLKGQDRITGLEGRITGYCEYISGCAQLLLAPAAKEGEFREPHWVDEQRVDVVWEGDRIVLNNVATPGPDLPAPRR